VKRPPILRLLADEIVVDNFAGGGGASVGLERALGRSPDIAINHDPEALAMHAANHPSTLHLREDVFAVDPVKVCAGRPVGVAWFSPDCTFFSKSRGGKPFRDRNKARRRRGLAWVVAKWAKIVRPRIIMLENVEEFADWGPLGFDGLPDPERLGFTFRRWWSTITNLGYVGEMREMKACDFGAPTSRKRLYIVFRCDGEQVAWPEPTHGKGRAKPHRTAAEIIDFSIPCPSIFLTRKQARAQGLNVKRPLAEKTLRRIARGVMRFVVNNPRPFIIPVTHGGDLRVHSVDEPMRTITGAHRGEHAIIIPTLIQTGRGERPGQAPRVPGLDKPLGVVQAEGVKHAVVAAFLAKHNGGHEATGSKLELPIATIKCRDSHALVASSLVKLKGTCRDGHALDEPIPTIQAGGNHLFEVRAFLMKYYGEGTGKGLDAPAPTITTKDRLALVTVTIAGEEYVIVDIGMRMLKPRELARATGVGDDYRLDDFLVDGEPLTQEAQVRCIGNMVCPDMAEALARANLAAARARGEQRRLPGVA
jgi:DNA (cytosine-5)-methyltransferase 1